MASFCNLVTAVCTVTHLVSTIRYKMANTTAEAVFNSIGPAYETAFAGLRPQLESIEWLKQQLATEKPSSCLDIGCGTGQPVCSSLASAGHDVLGIDISGTMITAARERVSSATFKKIDLKDFVAEPGSFDAITVYFSMIASVSHFDIQHAIASIYGWLRHGGLFIFATVTVPEACENVTIKWMGKDVVVSGIEADMAVDWVKQAGFEVVRTEASNFLPKAVEAGICRDDEVWEEDHIFVYAKKA